MAGGTALGEVIFVVLMALVWGSIRQARRRRARRYQEILEKAEAFQAAPVVNSHRVPCPECGAWATLMVNAAGHQKRVCDQCGETYYPGTGL